MTTPEPTNLVYDVVHDLQTPLTALKIQLSQIHKAKQPDTIKACHEIIDSMSSMVNDLLAYARSGTGFDAIYRKRFDISAHIIDTLESVEIIARSYRVKISKEITPGIIIDGIPKKIDEAFLNVVSNGMKYLKSSGQREIYIDLKRSKNECVLSVEDTGIGIPAEDLEHVFTRFYRTIPATHHAPGSGLGLAITKKIVELHGGTILIESTEGIGTRVEMRFPLSENLVT